MKSNTLVTQAIFSIIAIDYWRFYAKPVSISKFTVGYNGSVGTCDNHCSL